VEAFLILLAVFAGAWLLKIVFGKAVDVTFDAAEGVATKAKSVVAKVGHSAQRLSLRAQTINSIKLGLDVSDQYSGVNELGLDTSLSKKNEMLAKNIAERSLNEIDDWLDGSLPSPSLLAAYALFDVASQLTERAMREKARIAGGALMELVKKEAAEQPFRVKAPVEQMLVARIAATVQHLDTEDLAIAFESKVSEGIARRAG
jgi:hypothetical protein